MRLTSPLLAVPVNMPKSSLFLKIATSAMMVSMPTIEEYRSCTVTEEFIALPFSGFALSMLLI